MESVKRSIRGRILRVTVIIAASALILASLVGVFGMLNIRQEASAGSRIIGERSAEKSEGALLEQTQKNMLDIVQGKALFAESVLMKYADFVRVFAQYAQTLYENPAQYGRREVQPPQLENEGVLTMQRYLARKGIKPVSVWDEMGLLGNLEDVFAPVMEEYERIFATVYVGSESGFLLSYDGASHTAYEEGETSHPEEFYYEYTSSAWYRMARKAEGPVFTDTYQDSYGRGLTVTCVCPIRDEEGNFKGAVALDILIDDLNRAVIDIDVSEHSYAFLCNRKGDVIASPLLDEQAETLPNIFTDPDNAVYTVSERILSGESGVALGGKDIYYAYSPIASSAWTLVVHIPEADIVEPINLIRGDIEQVADETAQTINGNIRLTMLIFGCAFVAIIVLVVLISLRMANKMTRPIVDLGRDVAIISSGNLDHRSQVCTGDEIGALAESFNHMTLSLQNHIAKLTSITAEKERIGAELNVATQIQASMLPRIFPAFPDRPEFDIYAVMDPAKEVGGDFYDFFMVDETHLAIVMADVSGKGIPAALFMVIGKTLIKDHTQPGRELTEVFREVNSLLCESNSEDLFITAFEGVLDMVTGEFLYVNAGHEKPYLAHANGDYELMEMKAGFVLAGMDPMKFPGGVISLQPGDRVFLYTDGVPEATNADSELYGMERLGQVLNRNRDKRPDGLLPAVKTDVETFVGDAPQFDDLTMLCLEYKERMAK